MGRIKIWLRNSVFDLIQMTLSHGFTSCYVLLLQTNFLT